MHTLRKHRTLLIIGSLLLLLGSIFIARLWWFERVYTDHVYPNVIVGGVAVGGWTPKEVEQYWLTKNDIFSQKNIEFRFEDTVATLSANDIRVGFDATLSATQAYLVGRSNYSLSNLVNKFFAREIVVTPYFRWDTDIVNEQLFDLSQRIDIPVQEALFDFDNGRVTAFKPSKEGRQLNMSEAKSQFRTLVEQLGENQQNTIVFNLPVDPVIPSNSTDESNSLGIRELIGRGYSEFAGSIPGRIHNVALSAAKLHGVLIAPGETLSFTETVGDISALTGFRQAYVIQNGRTVLGDGGGVCQVSSTLFRAALNAGLPIEERQAHAYRVHYYEDGGFKPGLDATVFSPTVDLKINNDTTSHILIQTKTDTKNMTLVFELYGTSDGRKAEILNHVVHSVVPPPPPLYQEDPTLKRGETKQVDWEAWGAKASFQYKVVRGDEVLQDRTFASNFRPWQAIYLTGTLD